MKASMKPRHLTLIIICLCLLPIASQAQITERERPEEWDTLVLGGRFMDRFMPMPIIGELTSDTWGAANTVPRYIDNGLENSKYSYWGGNAVLGEDGKYHLFVCGWREDSPKGHMYWSRSTVFHAVAENSFGPYTVKDSIGPGHNPEVFQLGDGRYVIYVTNAYYISNNLDGPWTKSEFEFYPRDRKIIEGLSNLSFTRREDNSYLMVCRGGGIWFSETGITPYYQITDKRVYPPVDGNFEDPVVWRTNIQYHMIVNDWRGRIAYYMRSKDGIKWKVDPGEAYMPGLAKYEDGTKVDWFKYERIKVLQDSYGRASQAHFAVIDTIKWNDLENDNHSSKHIIIPLKKGRLISISDKEPITKKTREIRLKIEYEDGFDPQKDIDLESLRLGAPGVINYGKGCTVLTSEPMGKDLIVTFSGEGNGIDQDNFTAKLIGKTNDGDWIFGYSRLPGVKYLEPALSVRNPILKRDDKQTIIEVEVQNFGQVDSKRNIVYILSVKNNQRFRIASSIVGKLAPFEKITLKIPISPNTKIGEKPELKAVIK